MLSSLNPNPETPIELLRLGSEDYTTHRPKLLRSNNPENEHIQPAAIALPRTADEVARVVRWATSCRLQPVVRGAGNDFFSRSIADGALVIDMRHMNCIQVDEAGETVQVGGGVVAQDLVKTLAERGLMTPIGNTWILGYTGWAINGGYGPYTNLCGMGFEQIVGAQLVNAKGEVVDATEEMLEGVRGMLGHLGVVTSLTVKTYPRYDTLSGRLIFDSTDLRKTITEYLKTQPDLPVPKELTYHHFIMFNPQMGKKVFSIVWTWAGADLEQGKATLQAWKDKLPLLVASAVEVQSETQRQESMPSFSGGMGSQRSAFLARQPTGEPDDELTALLLDGAEAMPMGYLGPGISWSGTVAIDPARTPANMFIGHDHSYFSCSSVVFAGNYTQEVDVWAAGLARQVYALPRNDVLPGGFPGTTPPGEKTAAQVFGDKWPRASELKRRYDPDNVFCHAIPKM
ncbi:hypothetical protein MCOR25_008224 [Pyricularia grisea]|nr:hypothetical protein MCOR25_008224 [Pyricularia grisea]